HQYNFYPSFFILLRPPPSSTLFPYTTLFRSAPASWQQLVDTPTAGRGLPELGCAAPTRTVLSPAVLRHDRGTPGSARSCRRENRDRKSTRLNSSHVAISYAVFCLKKKTENRL